MTQKTKVKMVKHEGNYYCEWCDPHSDATKEVLDIDGTRATFLCDKHAKQWFFRLVLQEWLDKYLVENIGIKISMIDENDASFKINLSFEETELAEELIEYLIENVEFMKKILKE